MSSPPIRASHGSVRTSQSLAALVVSLAGGVRLLGAFDHATLAGPASDQRVDRRPRHRHGFQVLLRLRESAALLEGLAQQLIGRDVTHRPGAQRVAGDVVGAQPRMPGAPPQRRLVETGGEALRRHRGEHADGARPRRRSRNRPPAPPCGQAPRGGRGPETASPGCGRATARRPPRSRARCSPKRRSR